MCREKDNHGFIMQEGPSLSQQDSASLLLQGLGMSAWVSWQLAD